MFCPYCSGKATLRSSRVVYTQDYGNIWVCENYPECDAFVGCHKGTDTPKGTLASEELRELRKHAHWLFDSIWKNGEMTRRQVYKRLAEVLAIPKTRAHIAMLDEDECRQLISSLQLRHTNNAVADAFTDQL